MTSLSTSAQFCRQCKCLFFRAVIHLSRGATVDVIGRETKFEAREGVVTFDGHDVMTTTDFCVILSPPTDVMTSQRAKLEDTLQTRTNDVITVAFVNLMVSVAYQHRVGHCIKAVRLAPLLEKQFAIKLVHF